MFVLFFFFFKQKTAYEMRISDWSSDVCSSDLAILRGEIERARLARRGRCRRGIDLAGIDAVQQRVDLVLGEKIVAHCMTKLVKYAASTSGLPVSSVRIFCTSPTTSACSFCLDRKSTRLNSSH